MQQQQLLATGNGACGCCLESGCALVGWLLLTRIGTVRWVMVRQYPPLHYGWLFIQINVMPAARAMQLQLATTKLSGTCSAATNLQCAASAGSHV
jgi:hypothetical protein